MVSTEYLPQMVKLLQMEQLPQMVQLPRTVKLPQMERPPQMEQRQKHLLLPQQPLPPEPKAPVQQAAGGSDSHGGGHSAFTVEEMWSQSSGPVRAVLLMLLVMLIGSMGVAIERFSISVPLKTISRTGC